MVKSTKKNTADKAVKVVSTPIEKVAKKRKTPAAPEVETKIVKSNAKKVRLSADLRPVNTNQIVESKASSSGVQTGSIVYLGHIPDGFYEPQMEKFFSQFGEVKRIKLFRSLKTNRSQGYAFIEFASPEVASVVADSMDGYFLMERKMVCHVVPAEKIHDKMFAKPKARKMAASSSDDEDDEEGEVEKTVDDNNFERVSRLHAKSMAQKQAKLREMGIDYEIPFAKPIDARVVAKEEEVPAAAPKTPKKKAEGAVKTPKKK